uniref:Nucelotide kinase n=1 Tax=Staphylococcus phage HS04 TaxID=3056398 RepID=A0AA49X1P1_9VIRU|nr:MAG: nucelotide kinase [Staphylococcus phage HS04]
MSVGDLSIGEYIKFSDRDNKQRYGQVLNVYQDVFYLKYVAVVKVDGIGTIKIDDNYDFISVPKPTSKEVEKTLDDKVNHPSHYTYGDIEIMDFIEQVTKDYKPELAFAIGNAITKTDLSHLHNITGIPLNTLWYQKERGTYNDKLKCFFTDTMPRVNKKQEFNERVVAKDEIWKYNEKYDLYVSNLGRMKRPDGKYKFANGCNGISTVIYKNKKYRAANIVYETFIGNLRNGLHAYPKDSRYNNLTADNLFQSTLQKYRVYRRNKGVSKPVYLVDSDNKIVEEFASTVEAQKLLFIDRRNIARKCNRKHVSDGLMYMWADEYEELNA